MAYTKDKMGDFLARKRTLLANERTLLAYWRTALAFIGVGLIAIRFFEANWVTVIASISLVFGAILFIYSTIRFWFFRQRVGRSYLDQKKYRNPPVGRRRRRFRKK